MKYRVNLNEKKITYKFNSVGELNTFLETIKIVETREPEKEIEIVEDENEIEDD